VTPRDPNDRERDVMLVADAVIAVVRATLPGMVRKECELLLQYARDERTDLDEPPPRPQGHQS
jgi:hypothetical protein